VLLLLPIGRNPPALGSLPLEDFLPSPDMLVLREDNVKVTLSLSQRSVTFFQARGAATPVPYQRMIRALVDAYAEKQGGKGG